MTAEINITPKIMAESFWDMSSTEQAQFFEELYNLLDGKEWPAHSFGEMQWLYMSDEVEKNPKAKHMACTLTKYIFLRASAYLTRTF